MNNEEIAHQLCQEYGVKNTSKLVRSAILEFTMKYSEKLLRKAKEVSMGDGNQSGNISIDDLRIAYDLINNIHTPAFEEAEKVKYQNKIKDVNSLQKLEFKEGVLTVGLSVYPLSNSMTAKEYQLGQQ